MSRKPMPSGYAFLSLILFAGLTLAQDPPAQRQPEAVKRPVDLVVLLPDARAQLTIDGRRTWKTGTRRAFLSPPLDPGSNYVYKLVAVWQPNDYTAVTRTRKVPVRAGQEVEIDLRRPDADSPDRIVIRYVPTPDEVVEAMLALAKVGKDDVVYDLGCGDGRMVIAAVHKGAKRGVGVDIDPRRIRESRANAKRAGVEDRIEFRQGDVLDIKDLGDATVVLLYLSEELNLSLKPVLLKTLGPGARIVSHRFTMGDWKPSRSGTVIDRKGEKYDFHLWTVGNKPK